MDSDSVFIKAVATAFMALVAVIGSCSVANEHKRATSAVEMQRNGADPLDIPCAIGNGTERYCELRAATKTAAQR